MPIYKGDRLHVLQDAPYSILRAKAGDNAVIWEDHHTYDRHITVKFDGFSGTYFLPLDGIGEMWNWGPAPTNKEGTTVSDEKTYEVGFITVDDDLIPDHVNDHEVHYTIDEATEEAKELSADNGGDPQTVYKLVAVPVRRVKNAPVVEDL